jgi:hypothetical protein
VDTPTSAFGQRQARAFDNLMQLPLSSFGYLAPENLTALSPTRAGALGADAFVAKVQGRYALRGFDRSAREYDVYFTLVHRRDGWRLADDGDGGTQAQVWDLPGMRVVRGSASLVVGNAPASRMAEYRAQADAGVARVNRVWGNAWSRKVVLVTPATTAQFAALLQRDANGGLDQVAAVTEGPLVPGQPSRADRVVVNPTAFTRLAPLGRRVVITHELTHVAVRSSTTREVPTWLSEGFADYVGYSGLELPRQRVAAELLARVRQGRGPTRLPTSGDFDPAHATIAPTYSAAWLACLRLSDTYGQGRLVSFYRAVAGAMTVPDAISNDPDAIARQAFSSVIGVPEQAFVTAWLRYLRSLSGSAA